MPVRMLAFMLLMPNVAFSYEPDRASDNVAAELAECAAYNSFISQAPLSNESAKQKYSEVGIHLLGLSVGLTNEKVALARFELALKTMRRETESNWRNVSIVINKYGYPCKDLAEDPDARLRYWLDKKD